MFENIKVGDRVVRRNYSEIKSIHTVTRVTETQLTLDNNTGLRIMRKTGIAYGMGKSYKGIRFRPISEKDIATLAFQANWTSAWRELTTAQVQQLDTLLESFKEVKR